MKCKICGEPITQKEPPILYHSEATDTDTFCCAKCEKQMDSILESDDPSIVKKAINYFYTYIDEATDKEAKSFLEQIVTNNASAVEELESKKEKAKPVAQRQKDYFTKPSDDTAASTGWISGMKIIAWFLFIATVIAGFCIASPYFGYSNGGVGLVIVLLSITIAFLEIGGLMVFLNLASDTKEIRRILEKKDRK